MGGRVSNTYPPHLRIGNQTNMKYVNLDYLVFSHTDIILANSEIIKIEKSAGNFKRQATLSNGTIVQFQHNKSDRYRHVLSGVALANLREQMSELEFVKSLVETGAEFKRIDMALTTDETTPDEFWVRADNGIGALSDGGAAKGILSKDHGIETVYVGDQQKRGRRGIFRCYRHDLKHGGEEMLTRFELEKGARNSQGAAKRLARGDSIVSVMNDSLSFPTWDKWNEIFSDAVKLDHVPRETYGATRHEEAQQSRTDWLLNQCAASLGKAMADSIVDHGHYNVYSDFMKIAKREYEKHLEERLSGSE